MFKKVLTAVLAGALAVPAAAAAHVTLQPNQATAGGFTVLNVRVPNESDDEGTVKVAVQMPDGFASASYEPVEGWDVEITREKAPTPIDLHGEEVTEQIDTITFTGDGKTGIVEPGQFQDFPISVRIPDGDEGTELTFKALQTYEGGEVVRWIGEPDSDKPAPIVTLLAAEGGHGAPAPKEEERASDEVSADTAAAIVAADDGTDALTYIALGLGGLGLILGAAAFARGGRRTAGS